MCIAERGANNGKFKCANRRKRRTGIGIAKGGGGERVGDGERMAIVDSKSHEDRLTANPEYPAIKERVNVRVRKESLMTCIFRIF